MALSGDARTAAQIDPAALRVLHVPPPYAYRCPFGTTQRRRLRERSRRAHRRCHRAARVAATVAAVLMEPNAGTNGIVAPDSFWPALRESPAPAVCR